MGRKCVQPARISPMWVAYTVHSFFHVLPEGACEGADVHVGAHVGGARVGAGNDGHGHGGGGGGHAHGHGRGDGTGDRSGAGGHCTRGQQGLVDVVNVVGVVGVLQVLRTGVGPAGTAQEDGQDTQVQMSNWWLQRWLQRWLDTRMGMGGAVVPGTGVGPAGLRETAAGIVGVIGVIGALRTGPGPAGTACGGRAMDRVGQTEV